MPIIINSYNGSLFRHYHQTSCFTFFLNRKLFCYIPCRNLCVDERHTWGIIIATLVTTLLLKYLNFPLSFALIRQQELHLTNNPDNTSQQFVILTAYRNLRSI
jgi:hypothetical protein